MIKLKKVILILSYLLIVLVCGCSSQRQSNISSDNYITENTSDSTASTAISENSNTYIETSLNKNSNYKVEEIINYIVENHISNGCFYDFDKDGIPELAEQTDGEVNEQISYGIYNFKSDIPKFLGWVCAWDNELILYMDTKTKQNFYVGDNISIPKGHGSVTTYSYQFLDEKIIENEISYYSYTWTDEEMSSDIFLNDNRFLGKKVLTDGFQKEADINKLLGVEDYLSTFEKMEEINLNPLWGYDYDNDTKNIIREALNEYYYPQ